MQTEATYIIRVDSTGTVVAVNGADGTENSGTASTVIQKAINDLGPTGGLIFIKRGSYVLSATLELADNVILEGESAGEGEGTRLTSTKPVMKAVSGRSNITLRRLLFEDCTDAYALNLTGVRNVVVEQCHFNRCSSSTGLVTAVQLSACTNVRLVECSFRTIQGPAIQNTIEPPTSGVQIIRCIIDGAGQASATTSDSSKNYGGIHLFKATDVLIDGNTVTNCGSIGIAVDVDIAAAAAPSFIRVINNAVSHNDQNKVAGQGHGIYVAGPDLGDYVVAGNVVADNGGNGIEVNSVNGHRAVIANNAVRSNGASTPDGIAFGWGIWVSFDAAVISGNIVTGNYGSGIALGYAQDARHFNVQGNVVANNGQGKSTNLRWTAGMVMVSGDPADTTPSYDIDALIQNNLIYDDDLTQKSGIRLDSNVDGIVIEGNRLTGNGGGTGAEQISFTANPKMRVRRNTGFVTENAGQAVFLFSTGSAVVVTHGLDITPNPSNIVLTPLSSPRAVFWVSNVTSTTFDLNRARLLLAVLGSATVGWSYAEN